jgi:hypothetical protein
MVYQSRLSRIVPRVPAVLLACAGAAWSFGAHAAPKTVCTVTINSSDEKE